MVMATLVVIVMAIMAAVLTVWYVAVPVEVVAGFFGAFRHGGMKRPKIPQ